MDITGAVEVEKKLKTIKGKTEEEIIKQLEEFEKSNTVLEILRPMSNMMLVFYI